MDKDRARRLDRLLTLGCRSLGLLRRVVPGRGSCALLTEGQVLPCVKGAPTAIIKLSGLGSLAMLSPVLKAYADAMASAEQYLVTDEGNRALLELLDWRVQPIYVETGGLLQSVASARAAVRQLRRARVAAVADIEYYSRACTLLGLLSGSPLRVALANGSWRRNIVTHAVPWNPRWHFVQVTRHMLSQLAGQPLDDGVALPLKADALGDPPVKAEAGRRLVCVNVNTAVLGEEGRLPLPHFGRLLSHLAEQASVSFAFIGSRREASFVQQAVEQVEGKAPATNLAGKTNLPQLLSLIKHSDLLVTNDTGPLHLAVGVGTPTLSFYGPSHPANYGPRGGPHIVAYGDAVCSPCINEQNMKTPPCRGENACLSALDPDELGRLALEALEHPPSAPSIARVPLRLPAEVQGGRV